MKKIIFALFVCLIASGVYADGLSRSEVSTIQKLGQTGIFTTLRTVDEWNSPIKTIDCASAIIKTKSFSDRRMAFVNQRIGDLNESLIAQNKRLEQERDDQRGVNIWLFIGILFCAFK